jgi:hypothetical protein
MASEHPMHTLQASALINEAYIRLVGWKGGRFLNPAVTARWNVGGLVGPLIQRIRLGPSPPDRQGLLFRPLCAFLYLFNPAVQFRIAVGG